MVSHKFLMFTYECSNHSDIILQGGYSSIGRTTVCGIVCSLFKSGYPPLLCCLCAIKGLVAYGYALWLQIKLKRFDSFLSLNIMYILLLCINNSKLIKWYNTVFRPQTYKFESCTCFIDMKYIIITYLYLPLLA